MINIQPCNEPRIGSLSPADPETASIVRQVVQQCARGNVNLQLGRYLTEEDKKILRGQVLEYRIKAPI